MKLNLLDLYPFLIEYIYDLLIFNCFDASSTVRYLSSLGIRILILLVNLPLLKHKLLFNLLSFILISKSSLEKDAMKLLQLLFLYFPLTSLLILDLLIPVILDACLIVIEVI